jgi:hypothetical protein
MFVRRSRTHNQRFVKVGRSEGRATGRPPGNRIAAGECGTTQVRDERRAGRQATASPEASAEQHSADEQNDDPSGNRCQRTPRPRWVEAEDFDFFAACCFCFDGRRLLAEAATFF